MKRNYWSQILVRTGIILVAGVLAGCTGGGGGSGDSIGSSTITGILESFEGVDVNAGKTSVFAGAVRANVQVQVVGTDLVATTADDGLFILSGVPAGARELRYQFGSAAAIQAVNVPENATVELDRVRIRNGVVSAERVRVEQHESSSSSDDSHSSSDDSSSHSSSDDSSDDEVEVRGSIASISGSSITVAGRTFQITGSTRVLNHNNGAIPVSALVRGELVEVEGDIVSGRLVARKIKKEDDLNDDSDDDDNDDDDDDSDDDEDDSDDDDDHGGNSGRS